MKTQNSNNSRRSLGKRGMMHVCVRNANGTIYSHGWWEDRLLRAIKRFAKDVCLVAQMGFDDSKRFFLLGLAVVRDENNETSEENGNDRPIKG